jgi:two-component system OmpR family response regulator
MDVNTTATTNADKKRILVVDDRPSDSRLVKVCLERTNAYVVREENDAKAALAAAEQFHPHLILLDVMMPGEDGGELAADFQAHPELKDVPIVFLTAAVTAAEVEAGGGAMEKFTFLAKPVVLTELLACIKDHVGA